MRKLPVIAAFSHSFRSTMNNLAFAFHVSWPWMLVLLPMLIAGNLYVVANIKVDTGQFPYGVFAFAFLLSVIQGLAFASIAVNWHRYVLLDEVPAGAQRLRVDAMVWRYFGNIILISLTIMLMMIPFGFVFALVAAFLVPSNNIWTLALLAIPFYVGLGMFGFALFYRYGLKLPAIALGRRDFNRRDSVQATSENFPQLVKLSVLYVVVIVAISLLGMVANFVLSAAGGNVGVAIGIATQLVLQWAMTILGITFLTSLYGYFVESRNF